VSTLILFPVRGCFGRVRLAILLFSLFSPRPLTLPLSQCSSTSSTAVLCSHPSRSKNVRKQFFAREKDKNCARERGEEQEEEERQKSSARKESGTNSMDNAGFVKVGRFWRSLRDGGRERERAVCGK
jgi:hypothetical protein